MDPITMTAISKALPTIAKGLGSSGATSKGLDLAKSNAGAIAQTGLGAMQMFYGARAMRNAKKMIPSRIDTEEQKYKAELDAIRKGNYTGAGIAEALRQLRVSQINNQQAIMSGAGGYGGAALAGVAYSNASLANEMGKLQLAQQEARQKDEALYGAQLNRAADRRSDLDMMEYKNAMQRARQINSDAFKNITAGINSFTGKAIPNVTMPPQTPTPRTPLPPLNIPKSTFPPLFSDTQNESDNLNFGSFDDPNALSFNTYKPLRGFQTLR